MHWNAISSAYNSSPFFEYYEDDFAPFYEKKYDFLFDFNEELRQMVCNLLDIHPHVVFTTDFETEVENDFRGISPKRESGDSTFCPKPYYQVFKDKHGFIPNLSIIDLLFNTGNEGILVLRDSFVSK